MAYITKHKMLYVLNKIDGSQIKDPIKNHFRNKYFFLSDKKVNTITIYFLFFKDPIKFIESNYIKWRDTKTLIYESKPAFHFDDKCELLKSDFENMYIPKKIRDKDLVDGLRQWADSNRVAYLSNIKEFIEMCVHHFNKKHPDLNLYISDFEKFKKLNSGVEKYENYSLEELKNEIKEITKEAKQYFEDLKKEKVLKHFRNKVFLGHSKEPIKFNPTNIDENEVKEILKEIDEKYIAPINEVIIQICIKEFISNKEFSTTILEVLNFKNCSKCYSDYNKDNKITSTEPKDSNSTFESAISNLNRPLVKNKLEGSTYEDENEHFSYSKDELDDMYKAAYENDAQNLWNND
jgi:hypothetical protein